MQAIHTAVTDSGLKARAADLGARIRAENGVARSQARFATSSPWVALAYLTATKSYNIGKPLAEDLLPTQPVLQVRYSAAFSNIFLLEVILLSFLKVHGRQNARYMETH